MTSTIFPITIAITGIACGTSCCLGADVDSSLTYRRIVVEEADGQVISMKPVPDKALPCWARAVSQKTNDWSSRPDPAKPFFAKSIPFVIRPADEGEPFHAHNHQPSITWCNNGDLLAIWYSTVREVGTEMTVLASRLRSGSKQWDPASEFFKARYRNMTGSALFRDVEGKLYHFNGMGPDGVKGWARLALLMRTSLDNGVTWTPPQAIDPRLIGRHQVISGTLMTRSGVLIQNCDAVPGGNGGTALHISQDGGKTWADPGEGKPRPTFREGGVGEGTIAGIHGKVVELNDGKLMALGRGDTINGRMPMSLSDDLGKTWTYRASPFPPIGGGQRLVLARLKEGPIFFASFAKMIMITDASGRQRPVSGLFAALSTDEGKSWQIKRLISDDGPPREVDGGGNTGKFTMSHQSAEPRGYMSFCQTPDGVIHLISSKQHYAFNLMWLNTPPPAEPVPRHETATGQP